MRSLLIAVLLAVCLWVSGCYGFCDWAGCDIDAVNSAIDRQVEDGWSDFRPASSPICNLDEDGHGVCID